MTKRTLILLLASAMNLFAITAFAQGYTWQPLTPADAIQAVRDFEGDANLPVTIQPYIPPRPDNRHLFSPAYDHLSDVYKLRAGNYEYRVNTHSRNMVQRRDVTFALDKNTFYGQPYDPSVLKQQAMSQDEAQLIAKDYMLAHFPHPEALSKLTVSKMWNSDREWDATYAFIYSQVCDNGVHGPSQCQVTVDTVMGKVMYYGGFYFPVLASTIPRLSGDQAMACAIQSLIFSDGQPGVIQAMSILRPDVMGLERLVYHLTFAGRGPENRVGPTGPTEYVESYTGIVDASTGELIEWGMIMSLPDGSEKSKRLSARGIKRIVPVKHLLTEYKPLDVVFANQPTALSYPVRLVDGQPYLYVGYLCYGAKDVKLRYNGRDDISIVSPERAARFSLHKAEYTLSGKTRALPAKPVIVEDRCYVPLQAAQDTMPFRIVYDDAKKQVRFDALPAPAKTARANAAETEEVVFGGKH